VSECEPRGTGSTPCYDEWGRTSSTRRGPTARALGNTPANIRVGRARAIVGSKNEVNVG